MFPMNIITRAAHFSISDEQRASLTSIFSSLEEHVSDKSEDLLSIEVSLAREKDAGTMLQVDATLREKGHVFSSHAEAETLEAAAEEARAQLSRERSHVHGRMRRLGRRAALRTKEWLRFAGS
jgi:ribosome-associated translation inhibitor RaiA